MMSALYVSMAANGRAINMFKQAGAEQCQAQGSAS